MVNPLPQQLDWGLGAVHFLSWHVQIIYVTDNNDNQWMMIKFLICDTLTHSAVWVSIFTNIDNTLLSHRRSKHALSSSVQFGHNDVLSLICWGSGWEANTVWCVLLFRQLYQEAFVDDRFAGASGPNKQHGNFMCKVCTQEKKLTCRLHGWDDEVWYLVRKSRVSANMDIHSGIFSSSSLCDINTLTLAPAGMTFSSSVIESVQTFHCPCPSLWK